MASHAFLRIADEEGKIRIKGDVKRANYLHWIEVSSVHFGLDRGLGGATRSREPDSGQVAPGDVYVTRKMDAVSQDLIKETLAGQSSPATIAFVETTGLGYWREYWRAELKDTLFSGYAMSENKGEALISFTLNHKGGTIKVG